MALPKGLKSKKLLVVGAGLVGVLLVGFFVMKFMTSGGAEMTSEKPRSARRSEKKISKPEKKEEKPKAEKKPKAKPKPKEKEKPSDASAEEKKEKAEEKSKAKKE